MELFVFVYRYLVKYNVTFPDRYLPVTLESQFSYKQHYKILDPLGPIGRLKNLEVGLSVSIDACFTNIYIKPSYENIYRFGKLYCRKRI